MKSRNSEQKSSRKSKVSNTAKKLRKIGGMNRYNNSAYNYLCDLIKIQHKQEYFKGYTEIIKKILRMIYSNKLLGERINRKAKELISQF